MEGHEEVPGMDIDDPRRRLQHAAAGGEAQHVAVPDIQPRRVLARDLHIGVRRRRAQRLGAAGLGAGVEVMHQATGGQQEGVVSVWRLR